MSSHWIRSTRGVRRGATCDLMVGVERDRPGSPYVLRCRNKATATLLDQGRQDCERFPVYACEDCASELIGGPDADK